MVFLRSRILGPGLSPFDGISQLGFGEDVRSFHLVQPHGADTVLRRGSFINPAWFAFKSSRGFEHQLLKVYMRATVLVSEYFTYIPAVIILNRAIASTRGVSKWESTIALIAILMQPSTILIDYAHFQYNTVMLGFVLASTASIMSGRHLWACIFFVASLCFKQMSLYYAPVIAAYLMGICLDPRPNITRLIAIATTTLISFAAFFSPLVLGGIYDAHRGISPDPDSKTLPTPPLLSSLPFEFDPQSFYYPALIQLAQSIHRIFPFARGIFEDKVANLWCALHTVHKLTPYSKPMIQQISLLITIASILPASMIIMQFPRRELVPWAMASSAWGFFMCSFQVHEKSVLLPLLPMTIMLGGDGGLGPEMRAWIGWANMLGVWTMFPLLKRDELRVPYAVLSLLWAYLLGLPPAIWNLYLGRQPKNGGLKLATRVLHAGFYVAMIVWHGLEAFVKTPEGKPDLWVVINVFIGAAGFGICYLWCTWQLILRSGILEEYFGFRMRVEASKTKKRQ